MNDSRKVPSRKASVGAGLVLMVSKGGAPQVVSHAPCFEDSGIVTFPQSRSIVQSAPSLQELQFPSMEYTGA